MNVGGERGPDGLKGRGHGFPRRDRARLRRVLDGFPQSDGLAAEPERREVTVLFADIRGFTALTERHPPTLIVTLLNRYLLAMSEVVARYRGVIDQVMGDGMLVRFGAPQAEPRHVELAIACAVEMQLRMEPFNAESEALGQPQLYIGIGVNSGEVVAGTIGSGDHRHYTVIGSEVNIASRIEALSLRGQVLLGEASYCQAESFVRAGPENRVHVKGRRSAVVFRELLATRRPRLLSVPRRDSRRSPRIEVHMPLYFQCLTGSRVLEQTHCAEVLDVSYHGARMVSPVPLEPHCEIRVALSLHLLGSRTCDIYARVVKSEPVPDGCRCSVEFVDIDPSGQQTIKCFVDAQLLAG
jgi:adenylate cyclase